MVPIPPIRWMPRGVAADLLGPAAGGSLAAAIPRGGNFHRAELLIKLGSLQELSESSSGLGCSRLFPVEGVH